MNWFKSIPMQALVIVLGVITVIGWITMEGTIPLVISIVAGGLIGLRGSLGASDSDSNPD